MVELGVSVREIADKVVATELYEGAPAQKGGLLVGDVIVSVNGTKIDSIKILKKISKFLKDNQVHQ